MPDPSPPPTSPPEPAGLTKEQALDIARTTVAGIKSQYEYTILEDKTVEKPFGWVFFYTTKKYVETKDPKYQTPGNGPLVVQRSDGKTFFLATSMHPKAAIEMLERRWQEKRPLH